MDYLKNFHPAQCCMVNLQKLIDHSKNPSQKDFLRGVMWSRRTVAKQNHEYMMMQIKSGNYPGFSYSQPQPQPEGATK